jgi:hypothetical protein
LSGGWANTMFSGSRRHTIPSMHDPKVSIYALHDIAYLPQRYHSAFLDLIVRLRHMDEEPLNRTLMGLTSKAIQRVLSPDDVKRLDELVGLGQLNAETLARFSGDPNSHVWDLERELTRSESTFPNSPT